MALLSSELFLKIGKKMHKDSALHLTLCAGSGTGRRAGPSLVPEHELGSGEAEPSQLSWQPAGREQAEIRLSN